MTSKVEKEIKAGTGKIVVIDCGASKINIGFAGMLAPTAQIPSIVGKPSENYANQDKSLIYGVENWVDMSRFDFSYSVWKNG